MGEVWALMDEVGLLEKVLVPRALRATWAMRRVYRELGQGQSQRPKGPDPEVCWCDWLCFSW